MSDMTPKISVVVCTYNRGEILTDCLLSLVFQSVPKEHYEVIVVNNNSTDSTQAIAEKFLDSEENFRVVIEPIQGISQSRNRGWREAKGEYVAYTDDDCRLPNDWLEKAIKIIDEYAPDLFGGPFFAAYNCQKPPWYKDEYGSFSISSQPMFLSKGEFLPEGNLFIKKYILSEAGGFNRSYGGVGKKVRYGEGAVLQQFLFSNQPDVSIYYDPNLFVYHLVRSEKFSFKDILIRGIISSRDAYEIFEDKGTIFYQILGLVKDAIHITLGFRFLLGGGLIRNKNQFPYYENYIVEAIFPHFFRIGKIIGRFESIKTSIFS